MSVHTQFEPKFERIKQRVNELMQLLNRLLKERLQAAFKGSQFPAEAVAQGMVLGAYAAASIWHVPEYLHRDVYDGVEALVGQMSEIQREQVNAKRQEDGKEPLRPESPEGISERINGIVNRVLAVLVQREKSARAGEALEGEQFCQAAALAGLAELSLRHLPEKARALVPEMSKSVVEQISAQMPEATAAPVAPPALPKVVS